MKPQRTFVAERPVARHCPQLLRSQPEGKPATLPLEPFVQRLARALALGLARLIGGDQPLVRAAAPGEATIQDLVHGAEPLAACSLLSVSGGDAGILVTCEAHAIFRLIDRAFGGSGAVPDPLPESFPLSAELFIARIEQVVTTAIQVATEKPEPGAIHPVRRESRISLLAPLVPAEPLTTIELEIADGIAPWKLTLAVPHSALAALIGDAEPVRETSSRRHPPADPADEPFAGVPLPVSAVLVDMRIPFSKLSGLRPGVVIPVAVARKVPLRIGDRTIAHGTVGDLDDRVAVQVTQAF